MDCAADADPGLLLLKLAGDGVQVDGGATEHQAAETARTAYASALAGGWTAKQLSEAGLRPPTAPRVRKSAAKTVPAGGENNHSPAESAAPAVG